MKLPRLYFSTAQLLLLTALVALGIALATTVYQRVRRAAGPVAIAYSPDGALVAARFNDGRVRVWRADGTSVASLSAAPFWASWTTRPALALIDDKHLVTTSAMGRIDLWNFETEQRLNTFGSSFSSAAWETASIAENGRRVASIRIGATPGIDIWDVVSGARVQRLNWFGTPRRMDFSDDGARLAMVEHNGRIQILDIATGRRVGRRMQARSANQSRSTLIFAGDLSKFIESAPEESDAGTMPVYVTDVALGPAAAPLQVPSDGEAIALSPDGNRLATLTAGGEIGVWDVSTGQSMGRGTLAVPSEIESGFGVGHLPSFFVKFSPDGKSLMAATSHDIALFDLPTMQRRVSLGVGDSRLGWWFFTAAFAVWAVLWGKFSPRATTANAPQSPEASTHSAPRALLAVWLLMAIGGVWGIGWAMWVVFNGFTLFALSPLTYYGLYVGLRATAAGTGRSLRSDNLSAVALVQMLAFFAGDVLNPPLGLASWLLLRRTAVRQYFSALVSPAAP